MQQSPQRKGKAAAGLRLLLHDQLTKLQIKHQQECELLEDIKNFSKQRAAIERTYAEALLRLATQYSQRKIPVIPDIPCDDGKQRRNVYAIWKMLLDENEKLAKARLAAAEVYHQQIFESAKHVKTMKIHATKKCLDQIAKVHEEVQVTTREMDKFKKAYFDEEHLAHDARGKAAEAEEKLKRKKGNFFQSISSLQKNSAKFSSKRETCDQRSTGARNDYLLQLAALNAQLGHYHDVNLADTIKAMDNDVYEKMGEYFQVLSRTELLTCAATHSSFSNLREVAELITRQYNLHCYLNEWPVLRDKVEYNFEPCDGDNIREVTADNNASNNLSKEARRLACKVVKEAKAAKAYQKELATLQRLGVNMPRGEGEPPLTPQEVDVKIEELKQNIRRSETSRIKAEAKIEAMRGAEINVEEIMRSADIDTLGPFDAGLSRASSQLSVKTDASGAVDDSYYDSDYGEDVTSERGSNGSPPVAVTTSEIGTPTSITNVASNDLDARTQPVIADTDSAWDAETTSITSFAPVKATALFSYVAQNADELSFEEQEPLEIISEGDGDGWVKARNSKGEEGFIPNNYVDFESGEIAPAPQSFSSVDYTWPDDSAEVAAPEEPPPDIVVEDADSEPVENPPQIPVLTVNGENNLDAVAGEEYCRAMYDYEATCPGELNFVEGQMIRIVNKTVHGVDDGWWEGEVDGRVGLFPSLVVQAFGEEDSQEEDVSPEEDASPPAVTAPPLFSPPPMPTYLLPPAQVIVTQPTPDVEQKTPPGETSDQPADDAQVSYAYEQADFELELSEEQQAQYNTQFDPENNTEETEPNAVKGGDESEELPQTEVNSTTASEEPKAEDIQLPEPSEENDTVTTPGTDGNGNNQVAEDANGDVDLK